MRKHLVILLCVIAMGCQKESGFLPLPPPERLLTSIEYTNTYTTNNQFWVEDYFYDIADRLVRVDDLRNTGRRYELRYEQERLVEVETYRIDDNQLIFRDELYYNEQGQLSEKLNFSINGGETIPLANINRYKYNLDGVVAEKLVYLPNEDTPLRVERYVWDKGNIIQVENYDGVENLRSVFSYKYDQSFNYNQYQTHRVNDFSIWNQNNIIHVALTKDCTGIIDLICNPCTSEFTYTEDNYPIQSESSFRTLKMFYD